MAPKYGNQISKVRSTVLIYNKTDTMGKRMVVFCALLKRRGEKGYKQMFNFIYVEADVR